MNSGITESRRNASMYPEKSEQSNEGFAEIYKQKYESLKKIADEQFKNIVIIYYFYSKYCSYLELSDILLNSIGKHLQ